MYKSAFSSVLVLLFALCFTRIHATPEDSAAILVARQAPAVGPNDCATYAHIANFSQIALNGTMRTAFLQASPAGTMVNQFMFDAATKAAPALAQNSALNQACGNLTQIAVDGLVSNFTQGIVGQFTFKGNPQAIQEGIIIPIFMIITVFVFFGCMFIP